MMQDSSLKIIVAASGSRGDVQPYIALALALRARGHSVSVATENRMRGLVEEFGVDYRFIGGDPTGLLWEPKAQAPLRNGSMMTLISLTKEWDRKFDKREILNSYVAACSGADLIIASPLTMTQTYCVAEYLQCAWAPMILGPTLPTSEFPLWVMAPLICCCSCLNKWTYSAAFKQLWKAEKVYINPWRTEMLGLPPITDVSGISSIIDRVAPPVIIACSPLISGPFGRTPADYPINAHMNGFIFVPASDEAAIDPALVAFLRTDILSTRNDSDAAVLTSTGRPVIYLGFGSMPAPNPVELLQIALHTCNLARCRAVLIAGWSQLDSSDCQELLAEGKATGTLFVARSVPHDWLFPKMSCIVHHCGIGTTAAALRSGIPQVPCPVMLDQPFNAKTILRLGVAPGIIPFSKLSARRLAPLVQACLATDATGSTLRRVAQNCGEQVQREASTATETYCVLLEQYGNSLASRRRVITKDSFSSTGNDSFLGGVPPGSLSSVPDESIPSSKGNNSKKTATPPPTGNKSPARESASSILYSSNSGKQPAFGRSNTLGFGSPSSNKSPSGKGNGLITPKGLARSESVGPGSYLDLDADSDSAGMWRTNYTPMHASEKDNHSSTSTSTTAAAAAPLTGRNSGKKFKDQSDLLSQPLVE